MKVSIKAQREKRDGLFLASAREGGGKSHVMLNLIAAYDELKGTTTPASAIARNIKEFIRAIWKAPEEGIVALDEGSELSSTRTMERMSKDLQSLLTVIREKRLIVILCVVNPARIQTYFSVDRVNGVFLLKRRGMALFYDRRRWANVLNGVKKGILKTHEDFHKFMPKAIVYFPEYKGRLLEDYNLRKKEYMDSLMKGMNEKYNNDENILNTVEGSKYLGISVSTLVKRIRAGEIPAENTISGRYRLKREDLDIVKNQRKRVVFNERDGFNNEPDKN